MCRQISPREINWYIYPKNFYVWIISKYIYDGKENPIYDHVQICIVPFEEKKGIWMQYAINRAHV